MPTPERRLQRWSSHGFTISLACVPAPRLSRGALGTGDPASLTCKLAPAQQSLRGAHLRGRGRAQSPGLRGRGGAHPCRKGLFRLFPKLGPQGTCSLRVLQTLREQNRAAVPPRPRSSTHHIRTNPDLPRRDVLAVWTTLTPGQPALGQAAGSFLHGDEPAQAGGQGAKVRGLGGTETFTSVGLTSILVRRIRGTSSSANH